MNLADLREETPYEKGSEVCSKRWGKCRVSAVYPDKVCVIIENHPLGLPGDYWPRPINSSGDYWMRIVDGELVDWTGE